VVRGRDPFGRRRVRGADDVRDPVPLRRPPGPPLQVPGVEGVPAALDAVSPLCRPGRTRVRHPVSHPRELVLEAVPRGDADGRASVGDDERRHPLDGPIAVLVKIAILLFFVTTATMVKRPSAGDLPPRAIFSLFNKSSFLQLAWDPTLARGAGSVRRSARSTSAPTGTRPTRTASGASTAPGVRASSSPRYFTGGRSGRRLFGHGRGQRSRAPAH